MMLSTRLCFASAMDQWIMKGQSLSLDSATDESHVISFTFGSYVFLRAVARTTPGASRVCQVGESV
jgi:hypothetical protein